MLRFQLIRGNFMYGIDLEAQEKNWNGKGLPSLGDVVLMFGEIARIRCIVGNEIFCSFEHDKAGLCVGLLSDLKPTPTPVQTAKQKAIDEMFKLTKDCADASDARLTLYDAGYTKSKVKPLPKDWYNTYHNSLDDHQLSVYEWLVERGYCIGSAD